MGAFDESSRPAVWSVAQRIAGVWHRRLSSLKLASAAAKSEQGEGTQSGARTYDQSCWIRLRNS